MSCRHRQSWLLMGGYLEWCYQCGAFRRLERVKDSTNAVGPVTPWCRPTGLDGPNPWERWARQEIAYRKRMGARRREVSA